MNYTRIKRIVLRAIRNFLESLKPPGGGGGGGHPSMAGAA
jgi:hypothetical protein